MHRRQLIAVAVATFVPGAAAVRARIPPMESGPVDFAAISFDGGWDDPVRSVTARISIWRDAATAEAHRQEVLHGAGRVPPGEFYATTPVAAPIPAGLEEVQAGFATWRTTVGAAAVQTDWALLAWRDGSLVSEVRAATQPDGPAEALVADLAVVMRERQGAGGPGLTAILPALDDLPEGMEVAYRISPSGTVNGEGTPIPEPTPA